MIGLGTCRGYAVVDIDVGLVRIDGGTQSRVAIDAQAVADYAEAMESGAELPPLTAFFDGVAYWLADGFHRYHAARKIGREAVSVESRQGTVQDALMYSYGANQGHGLRRSNEDKRKAIAGMLKLVEDWSDNRIAKHVGVSDKTVAACRASIFGISEDSQKVRTVERGGTTYQANVSNVGKSKPEAPPAPAPAKPAPKVIREEPPEEDFGEPDCDLADMADQMRQELEAYAKVMDADEPLAAARKEIARLVEVARIGQSRIDGLLNENAVLKSEVKRLQRKLEAKKCAS